MLRVHQLSPADAAELFRDVAAESGINPSRWQAGCRDGQIREHLRAPGPHVRGCFAVDLLLGKG
jgi:hypothetical protein